MKLIIAKGSIFIPLRPALSLYGLLLLCVVLSPIITGAAQVLFVQVAHFSHFGFLHQDYSAPSSSGRSRLTEGLLADRWVNIVQNPFAMTMTFIIYSKGKIQAMNHKFSCTIIGNQLKYHGCWQIKTNCSVSIIIYAYAVKHNYSFAPTVSKPEILKYMKKMEVTNHTTSCLPRDDSH